jgi:hypothetical protein
LVYYKRSMRLERAVIAMTIQHRMEGPSRSFTIIVHTYIISTPYYYPWNILFCFNLEWF